MVFADAGTWIVAAIITFVVMLAVNILLGILSVGMLLSGSVLLFAIVRFVTIAIAMAIGYIFIANLFRMAIQAIGGVKPSLNELFKFGDNPGNVVLAAFMVGFATGLASICCVIPGLVIGGLSMFTLPLVVDRGMPAGQAFSTSIDLLKKDWLMATIFFVVAYFCSVILFGLTMAVFPIAVSLIYRDYYGFASSPSEPTPA